VEKVGITVTLRIKVSKLKARDNFGSSMVHGTLRQPTIAPPSFLGRTTIVEKGWDHSYPKD
jgi:hypothetical protein